MPREARHRVFEFMLACITGQYDELGMARVTFYNSLRDYDNWDDFYDMYRVLYALCKGGRDISGFEKNINKLLINWLDMTLKRVSHFPHPPARIKPTVIPYLSDILHLLTSIAKFNFALFEESEVTQMVIATQQAFYASNHPDDITTCLSFCDVVVRYRFVPFDALKPFLGIICGAVTLPKDALSEASISYWSIFLNLLRSHCAHNAILTLCNFMEERLDPGSSAENLAEGAITLLTETAWGGTHHQPTGAEAYKVSDTVLLLYFLRAVQQGGRNNGVIHACILKSLTDLVADPDKVNIGLMDWDVIWDICDICTTFVLGIMDDSQKRVLQNQLPDHHIGTTDGNNNCAETGDLTYNAVHQLGRFLGRIYKLYLTKQFKGPVGRFMHVLYGLRRYASESSATILLDYYEMEHHFLPSSENWIELLLEITNTFFLSPPSRTTTAIRSRVLTIVADVCLAVKDFYSEDMYQQIVTPMMEHMAQEKESLVQQKAIDLLVECLSDCQNEMIFDTMLGILKDCSRCRCTASDQHATTTTTSTTTTPSIHGQCTGIPGMCGIIDLFEQLLRNNQKKMCVKVYNVITQIANDTGGLFCPFGGPKLIAVDLLLRLRCSTNHRIFVIEKVPVTEENNYVLAIRKAYDDRKSSIQQERESGPYGSIISRPSAGKKRYGQSSPAILSYKEHENSGGVVLNINDMIKGYISVLSDSPNWELVAFVVRRLPWQLATKHMFCGARTFIRKLHRALVKWISSRNFLKQVTHIPPTVKRNDLNVYAYQILTVLISYRRLFKKHAQDEMVYAFYVGITQVTAATKPCINALTICCHELPLSVAKMLNEILQRMSQIISVGSVSVHILEFLSGLARLPILYSNFTGDMYKPVFAIALNYLQHARSVTASSGTSNSAMGSQTSPSSTPGMTVSPSFTSPATQQGAMSQYVLIMAYLVITVWFTAIPLRERRKHVPFIIQRLLAGTPADEQTFTCIDMLSRFTFADASLSPHKSLVSKILMDNTDDTTIGQGKSTSSRDTRTWVYGHTLLTLKTAKALGWVEMTIRRPSGTVSMMCNIENTIKSDDIDYKTLPALLMMQYQPDLMAHRLLSETEITRQDNTNADTIAERIHTIVRDILSDQQGEHGVSQQSRNLLRKMEPSLDPGFLYLQLNNYPDLTGSLEMLPPLPDDEANIRAIGNLDRIPVVDFHKIGVLYVGKGQKQEVEILANTRGSPDYVKFLNELGTIERLRGRAGNTGGLDREMDIDGAYAYFWKDDVTEMVFHVATMMPTHLDRDPRCSGKKRHIGNDFVTIVYFDNDDMAAEYAFDTLPGQFNFINIVVTPYSMSTETSLPSRAMWGQENTFFKVTMQKRPDMPDMGPISESKLISAQSLPGFVRQVSLHANIFAQIFHRFGAGGKQEYVSHWRERLRHIRRIKDRVLQQQQSQQQQSSAVNTTAVAATTSTTTSTSNASTVIPSGTAGGSTTTSTPNINSSSILTPTNLNGIISSAPPNSSSASNSTSTTPILMSMNTSKPHLESLFDFTRYT
ncbi:uncharacterized protein BX664DRAFT_293757 [Halteromyces radiatus]|uniref:uncharacterized protein n=1 Tax=Halteromyces radiatus TaxID=101107 RepID=UPI002220B49B|nr:uncharacterized protein BX664DRAFT_293757 [Halteromyces radiatus]KAI8092600.1 hypothetical protein BX664DRAFT_293757 [Halteromyces radiatus]